MKSSIAINTSFWLLCGLSAFVSATHPLGTVTPCPSCPKSVMPPPVTITAQYQPVSTCTPETVCSTHSKSESCKVEPSCSTYDWVSTEIPCLGGTTSTLVTKTDQIVELSHVSTVLTDLYPIPCPTKAPSWNGTAPRYQKENCTSTALTTMIVDISCPYDEMGPMAMPPWGGSGLCKTCASDVNGTKSQGVHVSKCLNGACSTYSETWVSRTPAPATSTSTAKFSSSAYCSSSGVNTIPVTTTCTPMGAAYTQPVTSTFSITTSVPSPQTVDITTVITVTFTGKPAPTVPSSKSVAPVSTSTFCSENGMHTIPITQTFTPTNPAYTPVTTTVFYTTSVTNAPTHIGCTTTITVIFTTTYCPETVVSGSTMSSTSGGSSSTTSASSSGPATVSASSTSSQTSSAPSGPTSSLQTSSGPTSSGSSSPPSSPSSSGPSSSGPSETASSSGSPTITSSPSTTPSSPPTVGECDFFGCLGSTDDFPTFSLIERSHEMTIELCTSECLASGMPYAGLNHDDCFCASSIDGKTGIENANGVCDLPCPGNALEVCGGKEPKVQQRNNRRAHKEHEVHHGMLLDVYECSVSTTTTSSTSTTSCTTSCGPDVSSDPDPEPEKRSLQADMEISQLKARDAARLRRGGMLRNPNQAVKGPALAKRDYGLKKNSLMS